MPGANNEREQVSAVIPAYSEGRTIGDVIAALVDHPLVGEVIVVSDGSTDDTVEQARARGARVIELSVNRGKAAAIEKGVQAASYDYILLLDADIRGLTPAKVSAIVDPVLRGDYSMFVALRERRTYWANRLLHFTPIIGGERALTRSLWNCVPSRYKRKFQIEIALNFFVKRRGERMGLMLMPGLTHVIKERKRGLWLGLYQRLSMCLDIVIIAFRLYVIFNLVSGLAKLKPARATSPTVAAIDQGQQ
ncbi:MAG TPA: glycosyltransferase family 2 protein [Steroidobacteraceae bacterium]|nr:glycosyltransferase family 2 protein [Steroidobacteraceae bacterium]